MSILNIDDYRKGGVKKDPEHERDAQMAALKQLHQAELLANSVTGMPEWDHFLAYIKGMKTDLERSKLMCQDQMAQPQLVNIDSIMFMKQALSIILGQISMLEWVLKLPKVLKEGGAGAKDALTEFEIDPLESFTLKDIEDYAAPPV